MNDDQLEERLRASMQRLDLPGAPERLIQRAAVVGRTEPVPGPSKFGLVLVVGMLVVVTVYASLQVASGIAPRPQASLSPSASEAASGTPPASESPAPTSTPTPTLRPFPVERPEPTAPVVEPAPDDVLALAGRGDVPGLLYCGFGLAFSVDAIENPTGAEDRQGPEYDALRDLLERYVTLGTPELGADPTAREVAHDDTGVMFLVDHAGSGRGGGFPFVPIAVDLVSGRWEGYHGVDCQPRAVLPPGYERATWTIDPAHATPTGDTRALHLLVQEHVCASGQDPSGRVGPAYVVVSRFEIAIEIIVQKRPGGQDCQGVPPVDARLSLPVTIGDRFLRDVNDYLHNQSGG